MSAPRHETLWGRILYNLRTGLLYWEYYFQEARELYHSDLYVQYAFKDKL